MTRDKGIPRGRQGTVGVEFSWYLLLFHAFPALPPGRLVGWSGSVPAET